MKIENIVTNKVLDGATLEKLSIKIDFDTTNPDNKPDGDALYYLICALHICNGKSHKDLDVIESSRFVNRIDACIAQLKNIKKELK